MSAAHTPKSLNRPLSRIGAAMLLCFGVGLSAAQGAEPFPEKLQRVLREHQLARMVDADVATAAAQVGAERSGYFPKLSVNLGAGEQRIEREQGVSGRYDPNEASVAINQLITDFGHTASRVNAARVVLDKEAAERELQLQNLTLAAIEAQLQLIQAERTLRFALQSEANIKQQTSLESARMEAGRGYATDVLQAKAQLAGAEARRVMAESRMREALNRYRTIFGDGAVDAAALEAMAIPHVLLPQSEDRIVDSIRAQNPDLLAAIKRAEVTLAEREVARNRELLPRLSLRVSRSRFDDYDGAPGRRDDTKAMLNLDWQFDLGMRARYVTESADQSVLSAREKADYVRVQAIEEGRNAWSGWRSARERAEFLANQVRIAGSFLELARKEREMGRRSLLDILNGEVALINAQSDATAARIDEIIAAYRLLRAVGQLSPDLFRQPGMLVPAADMLADGALPVPTPVAGAPLAAAVVQQVADAAPEAPVAGGAAALTQMVNAWAEAWSAKDVAGYLGHYDDAFAPADGRSREAWAAERGNRLAKQGDIAVNLRDLRVSLEGDRAQVRFLQRYRSADYNADNRKVLDLVLRDGQWRIVGERLGH